MTEALLFISAFLAEVVGTIVGFGSSTIFLPLALLFIDFKTALVLVALLHIFGNLGRMTFFRHGLNKRLVILFGIPSVFLTIAGAMLVNYLSQDTCKLIFGIFLLCFSVLSLLKPKAKFPATTTSAIVGGGLSGFFAGLIGTGGVLRASFLVAFNLEKNVYIATAALVALAVDITRLPIYFASGFLSSQYFRYIPLLFVVALAGSYLGKQIVNKVPQRTFKILVLLAIVVVSIKFIIEGLQIVL